MSLEKSVWRFLHLKNDRIDFYDNYHLSNLIDRYVRGEKDRAILKRRLIDGICFEPLAEEFDMSVRQIKNRVYKAQEKLFMHL